MIHTIILTIMTISLQSSPLIIGKAAARRFLLSHQLLLPPHQLSDKAGILEFIQHTGCIQFDPVNVVGRNPDLVLQARIKDYSPTMLHDLLYRSYQLYDAWDKQASICLVSDWPYFSRHRERMEESYWKTDTPEGRLAIDLLEKIRQHGQKKALNESNGAYVKGNWGFSVRMERVALDILYAVRKIHIADRIGSRRIFEITENLLPGEILQQVDPNLTLEDYHDWHVLRRIGGIGLARLGSSEYWLGIQYMKTPERKAAFRRLVAARHVIPVNINELPGKEFFIRRQDLPALEKAIQSDSKEPQAVFLAPLDNLLWDRKLLAWIFDFDYVWEVYKKAGQRKYGYYTMPVLYGEHFIARIESAFDRKTATLTVKEWWWEAGVKPDSSMKNALNQCFAQFMSYLGADTIQLGESARQDHLFTRLLQI